MDKQELHMTLLPKPPRESQQLLQGPHPCPGYEAERGQRKSCLKNSTLKEKTTEIRTSGPITSWQIEGGRAETVTDFIFLGSKITADVGCSHEI